MTLGITYFLPKKDLLNHTNCPLQVCFNEAHRKGKLPSSHLAQMLTGWMSVKHERASWNYWLVHVNNNANCLIVTVKNGLKCTDMCKLAKCSNCIREGEEEEEEILMTF